jgi:hypothetical protein
VGLGAASRTGRVASGAGLTRAVLSSSAVRPNRSHNRQTPQSGSAANAATKEIEDRLVAEQVAEIRAINGDAGVRTSTAMRMPLTKLGRSPGEDETERSRPLGSTTRLGRSSRRHCAEVVAPRLASASRFGPNPRVVYGAPFRPPRRGHPVGVIAPPVAGR